MAHALHALVLLRPSSLKTALLREENEDEDDEDDDDKEEPEDEDETSDGYSE